MALTDQQYMELADIIMDAFNKSTLNIVLMGIGKRLDHISTGDNFQIIAYEVVFTSKADGWTPDLIRSARMVNETNNRLKDFAESLPEQVLNPAAGPNPFDVAYLWDSEDIPFVDRQDFREAVRDLIDGRKVVLTVDGPTGHGKSYSRQFISYLHNQLQSYQVAVVDLTEGLSHDFSPLELAQSLARQMGLDETTIPENQAHNARWAIILCDWLAGQLKNQTVTWWVVIDGVNQVTLPENTLDMIKGLAKRAGNTMTNLRMILLSYGESLVQINPRSQIEMLKGIDTLDLEGHIRNLAAEQEVDVADDLIESKVETIRQRVTADQNGLYSLGVYLKEELQDILAV